jgi:ATP-grasp ribosomal peptide maturase
MGGKVQRQSVLILTQPFDFTADPVIEKLYERDIDVVRFDPGWFPRAASLVARLGYAGQQQSVRVVSNMSKTLDLSRIASIWYRRPTDFSFDKGLDPDAVKFARDEALHALGGVLRGTDCIWINHPEKLVSASYKPYQLMIAERQGWRIPRTMITNDPASAREFIESNANASIYKTLCSPNVDSDTYDTSSVYTSLISAADLDAIDAVRFTPCLLQEYIEKDFEVRVTVMGLRIFAVALHTPGEQVDWRPASDDIRYSVHSLPDKVADHCVEITRQLGLTFAAIDLAVTKDGHYVFLEVNPNGQWMWLEFETGLPMTAALIDCLAPFAASRGEAAT